MESILTSAKRLAGLTEGYDYYDPDVIAYINSTFFTLRQLGVGPVEGFVISDDTSTWAEFIPNDIVLREATRAYIGSKVQLEFNPPTNSSHLASLERRIAEYEWRLNCDVETTSAQKQKEG